LIWIGSPVRGLRPIRAARALTENVPKPTSDTPPPSLSVDVTASSTASTAFVASARDNPAEPATASISSPLFMHSPSSLIVRNKSMRPNRISVMPGFPDDPLTYIGQSHDIPSPSTRSLYQAPYIASTIPVNSGLSEVSEPLPGRRIRAPLQVILPRVWSLFRCPRAVAYAAVHGRIPRRSISPEQSSACP
jgi:hypothetical protein